MARQKKRKGQHVVGVDLGATKIMVAVVDAQGHILAETKRSTGPKGGTKKVIGRIAKSVQEAVERAGLSTRDLLAVGIGAPGSVDPHTGLVFHAPNLDWQDVPLGDELEKALGVPVFVENDVNAGTLAEQVLGAGQGTKDMVGIFWGTGVGGGLILNGQLRHGCRNAAGEVGHLIMMIDGPVCGCELRGCLEALASRTAINRDLRQAIKAGRKSVIGDLIDIDEDVVTSGTLAKALKKGDALTAEVMGQATRNLGILVANIVNLLDPEMVVIGGGVAEALGEPLIESIRQTAYEHFFQKQGAEKIKIVLAQLGDYAVLLGAAVAAQQRGS